MIENVILLFQGPNPNIDRIQLMGLENIISQVDLSSEDERKYLLKQILDLIYKYIGKTLIYGGCEDLMLLLVNGDHNGRVLQVLHYDSSSNIYRLLTLPYMDFDNNLNECPFPIKIRFIINSPYK